MRMSKNGRYSIAVGKVIYFDLFFINIRIKNLSGKLTGKDQKKQYYMKEIMSTILN